MSQQTEGVNVERGARVTGAVLGYRDPPILNLPIMQPKLIVIRLDTVDGKYLEDPHETLLYVRPDQLPEDIQEGSTFDAVIGDGIAIPEPGSWQPLSKAPYLTEIYVTGFDAPAAIRALQLQKESTQPAPEPAGP